MPPTVDALLPLSFLEAVRAVDRPDDDPDAEFVAELRNKRLGLSDTVYAQIHRYRDAVRRRQRQTSAEVAGLARLIGRRPDAEAVFRAAGHYLGERAYATLPGPTRRVVDALPAFFARPLASGSFAARRGATSAARCGATAPPWCSRCRRPLIGDAPCGAGCAYYEAGFAELLPRLAGGAGAAAPSSSTAPGRRPPGARPACVWRADGGADAAAAPARCARPGGGRRPRVEVARMLTPDSLARFPGRDRRRRRRRLAALRLPRRPTRGRRAARPRRMVTRRVFAWVPREGAPTAITHAIEQGPWARWPAAWPRVVYSGWVELEQAVGALVGGRRIAMEYSPGDAVPYVDRVPAGVVEMVRTLGATW
jgi:hypothetical protein